MNRSVCGDFNITLAFIDNGAIVMGSTFFPFNTFAFLDAFVLFVIQGIIFKPISSLIKRRSPWYRANFYTSSKQYVRA